jgi:hypothetical protein
MESTGFPKIAACVRMGSSSVRKRRSARTDLPSVQVFGNTCALRAPTSFPVRIHAIRTGNEVLQKNKAKQPA